MHPRWKVLSALVASCVAVATSTAQADDDPCAGKPDAAACYLSAAQAMRDTNPGEAAKLFLASYRLDPKIDPLTGYGMALAADQRFAAAAEALSKAAEEYEKLDAKFREANADAQTTFAVIHRMELVREEIKKLAPKIGFAQLPEQLPPGVSVVRKGSDDIRPAHPSRLVIAAGGDTLVFTYPSGRTAEVPVNVMGGLVTKVDVPPEPPPPVEVVPPPPPQVDTTADKLQTRAYIVGGAGAVLFAAGITYTLVSDPNYGVSAALVGGGLVGLSVGGYFWYQASQKRKQPATTTVLVPMFGDDLIGAAFVGRL